MSFWLVSLTFLKNNKSICIGTGLFGDGSQGVMEFFSIKKNIYSHFIVGNCSKCCSKVLNTHECRAKYSSK